MTAKSSFTKKVVEGNIIDEIKSLRRRIAALEVREGKDRGIAEAAEVSKFDPMGGNVYIPDGAGDSNFKIDENGITLKALDETPTVIEKVKWVYGANTPFTVYGNYDTETNQVFGWAYVNGNSAEEEAQLTLAAVNNGTTEQASVGLVASTSSSTITLTADEISVVGFIDLANYTVRSFYAQVADDAATSFTPNKASGGLIVGAGSNNGGIVTYATATPATALAVGGSNLAVATGALTGTTGTDGKFTISCHTDGKIYAENRTGASRNVYILLI